MAVLTKTQLLSKMNLTYVTNGNIRAAEVRSYQTDLIDTLFAGTAYTSKEVTLNGTTYQDNDLIGITIDNILLFNKGVEVSTASGTTFDSTTGTFTFPLARTGTAKLLYK